MKVIVRNVFEKPVILIMLILICLLPISPINKACYIPDPPDCSSEAAAMSAAADDLATAKANLATAETELNEAGDAISGLKNTVNQAHQLYINALLQKDQAQRSLEDAQKDLRYSLYIILIVCDALSPACLAAFANYCCGSFFICLFQR